MKKIFLLATLFISVVCFSQSQQLKLTSPEKKNAQFIKEGDKVLMAVKVAKYQVQKKPSDVYLLSKLELTDSVYVFTKGRVTSINDSTIIMKERNSFFSATSREIKVSKINTIKKLTAGSQVFRTAATIGAGLAFGVMILYSYVAPGTEGNGEFIEGMFYAAGTGAVLTRFGRTKIAKRHLDNWKIEVAAIP
jgi:hypothetical protein